MNIILLIKNHILKVLGPFGFQDSGSLSFDHIVDFYDYITVYLVFIFVLVIWCLFYAITITRFPRFVLFVISLWYGILLFIYATKYVALFLYNAIILKNASLYNNLLVENNINIGVRNISSCLDTLSELKKLLHISQVNSILLTVSSVLHVIYKFFELLIYNVIEFILFFYKIEICSIFDTMSEFIPVSLYNEFDENTTEDIESFFEIENITTITKEIITLYTISFNKLLCNYVFKELIMLTESKFFNFLNLHANSIIFALTTQGLIGSSILAFFNNGSTTLDGESTQTILNNFRSFVSSKSQVSRFARRITHASRLEIIWTIFPSIILLLIAIPSLILLYELDAVAPVSLGVKIVGSQWYWGYSIGSSFPIFQDLITLTLPEFSNWDSYMVADETSHLRLLEVDNPLFLPAGIPITFFITSSDVIHSWAVPALGIKVDAIPGRLNQVSLTIYDISIFYGQCSELCGVNHGFMPIQVVSLVDNSHLIH